jgi:hypothetical protein
MNTDNQKECCICFERIDYKNVSITECNHSFHTSCLLKYNNKKCPICRQLLYEEETNLTILVDEISNEISNEIIQQPIQQRPALIELYLSERNKMRKIIYKGIYIISQIYVTIFLIFCLRIACEISWIFIYESHMALAKYLF